MRQPAAWRERGGFCANYSTRGNVSLWVRANSSGEWRWAPRAAMTRPVEQRELAKLIRLCAAIRESRDVRSPLLRKPLLVPTARDDDDDAGGGGGGACGGTAYVSVLTVSTWGNTFMAKVSRAGGMTGAVATNATAASRLQWAQLLTLVASLRSHEHCRRDFVLLLGQGLALPIGMAAALHELRVTIVRITPLDPSIPPLDHLHAWRLTAYQRVVMLDSDMLAIRPLDHLFEHTRKHPSDQLIMGHHAYDKAQRACGLPVGAVRPATHTLIKTLPVGAV